MAGENLKPWQYKPGQSGNPSGKQRAPERVARDVADSLAGGQPWDGLRAVMRLAYERMLDSSVEDRDRRAWAQLFCERAYGKPREQVEVTTEPALTEAEYRAEINAIVSEEVAAMDLDQRRALLELEATIQ